MSYRGYNYSSPYGSHSYQHSSYVSPSGNRSYSSTSSYDSNRYSSRTPSYGSGLGGSLSNLSSSYITPSVSRSTYSSSPYSPAYSSAYSRPYSSSRYSGDFSTSYTPGLSSSLYTPSTSSYSSKYSSDTSSSYTPRSTSKPSYDVPTTSSSSRKTRVSDTDDVSDYKPRRKAAPKTDDVPTKKVDTSESRRRRRERAEEEASSTAPSRPAADVSEVTKQTESLNLDTKSTRTPSPKPTGSPKPAGSPARTTEIPCGDGVATKGKSAMNQQSANPDKIPVCAKCDCEIRGPFVLALNKSWCPQCFTCSKCGSELVNMGFVELNGNIYCENDYETFYAPKCGKCRKAIVGDTVNALEKTWHPACFVCNECGAPISSGAFHVEEGMPYCMNDWSRLFQTKCTGCSFPVEPGDKWIEALDANWHSECFVCGKCRTKLEGQPFYPRDGKPFCKEHAQG